ncbi:MAG TPA: type II secretion system F family protein, partial [Magnetococcales bacterium]|nr:type II secretion system F family protein [Magnetococcales bacterium]
MENYQWEAKTKAGEKRTGEMESQDPGEVAAVLRKRGLTAIQVKKVVKKKPLFGSPKITDMEIVVFTRQLATMVGAGLPLVTCFDLSSRGADNVQVREITSRVKKDIESGTSLTEALLKEPKMFDELFVNLVSAGEQSGILEAVLDRLSIYKEKAAAL